MSTYSTHVTSMTLTSGHTGVYPGTMDYLSTSNGKWVYSPSWNGSTDTAIQFDPVTDTWSDYNTSHYPHTITRDSSGVVQGLGPPGSNTVRFSFNCPYFGNTYVVASERGGGNGASSTSKKVFCNFW